MIFKKAAILGIGLIGSSLARNLKQNNDVQTLAVYDKNTENLKKAQTLNLGDMCTDNLETAVADADVVIFATPRLCVWRIGAKYQTILKKRRHHHRHRLG